MRYILIILFLLFSSAIQATTYYVSSSGNTTNSGLTTSATWNLAKVNSFTFSAGDEILIKRGDAFYGSITLSESGSIGNPIKISAYGSGAKPIISGFTNVTTWINLGGNIWESTSAISTLSTCSMVTVNGINTEKGRYPNNTGDELGYLYYQSHTTTSITSSGLDGVINWTGATVVLRPNAWAIATAAITSQSGGTLNYSSLSSTPVDGYGFFINNDVRTLDVQNEWYYNPTTKKIKIYSASQPVNVRVSTIDDLINIEGNYITVENLEVTGAENRCIWAYKAMNDGILPHHVIIQDCNTSFAGWYGIDYRGNYNTIQNCVVDESNWSGINGGKSGIGSVLNNTVTNTSRFIMLNAGAGIFVSYSVHAVRAEGNRVINSGENGMYIGGDSIVFVKNNYVDTFCTMQYDAAGIYCSSIGGTDNVITGNIIINGVGNPFGTPNSTPMSAHGIYLDEGVQNIEVDHNSISSNNGAGIFLHASANNDIHDNTSFDCFYQILFSSKLESLLITGNVTTNNKFIAKTASQDVLRAVSYSSVTNPITNFGTFNNNYYARPIDDSDAFYIQTSSSYSTIDSLTLTEWQSYSGQDANSLKSPIPIIDTNNLQFYYNDTNVDKVVFVSQPSIDVSGAYYVGNVTLEPFTSIVLIEKSAYYVSSTGNDSNDGLSELTPWQTLDKINSATFSAGDNILLKRGDTFYGSLVIDQSGSLGNPITLGAYGIGENPTITGFTTVAIWTNLGSNIWESTNIVSTLSSCNMVAINGANTPMGRYPNSDAINGGYLTFQSHSGKTSITSSSLTGTPNWTGAEVVIHTGHFMMDRVIITSQSVGTLNFNTLSSGYEPSDGNGFFIQNDTRTLDQQNEWYFNPSTDKLRIYSTTQPLNVKIASIDRLFQVQGDYITIDGLTFDGANTVAIWGEDNGSDHFTVKNCSLTNTGIVAINTPYVDYVTYEGNVITESNSSAIIANNSNTIIIRNNYLENIGVVSGMRNTSVLYGADNAISADVVESLTVEYNSIKNTGYNAISFYGTTALIRNNFIDTFCTILDDGGGIYTYTGTRTPMANVVISDNIVINGIGSTYGTSGGAIIAVGIYLDERSKNIEVLNNSVADVKDYGIFLNTSAGNINVHHNTVYNASKFQYYSTYWGTEIPTLPPTGNQVKNNIFVAKIKTGIYSYENMDYDNQKCMNFYFSRNDGSPANDLMLASTTFDNNVYARPIDDNKVIRFNHADWDSGFKTLAEWQTYSGQDANSKKSPQEVTNVNDLQFEYNATSTVRTIYPNWASIDVTGREYRAPVVLQPFTSLILIKDYTPSLYIPFGVSGKLWKF